MTQYARCRFLADRPQIIRNPLSTGNVQFPGTPQQPPIYEDASGFPWNAMYCFLANRTQILRNPELLGDGHVSGIPLRRLIRYSNRRRNPLWKISFPRKSDANPPEPSTKLAICRGFRHNRRVVKKTVFYSHLGDIASSQIRPESSRNPLLPGKGHSSGISRQQLICQATQWLTPEW